MLMKTDIKRREETANMNKETIYRKMDRDLIEAVKKTYDKIDGN